MSECICGFHPPTDSNDDCERCQLLCQLADKDAEIEQLRTCVAGIREALRWLDHSDGSPEDCIHFSMGVESWLDDLDTADVGGRESP